jgi:hypothetical protein
LVVYSLLYNLSANWKLGRRRDFESLNNLYVCSFSNLLNLIINTLYELTRSKCIEKNVKSKVQQYLNWRRRRLKAKLWLFFTILLFSLSFAALVSAQAGQVYFKEDFNYAGLDQMQAAGWTFTRPAGISVGSGAVVLDGTGGDCAIHYNNHFPTGIFDWKVESKSMWLGQGHTTNGVHVSTEKHSYSFSADGYYDEFAFYRDNVKILRFGSYQETANQYFVMTMVREANTFSLYFNGELKNTYTEEDTQPSRATGIALVSPWRGDAKYDYYMVGEPTALSPTSSPTDTSNSQFPTTTIVIIGGTIAALVVGGILVYYFFMAGSSTGAGATGASGTGGSGGSVIHDQPISPLSGEGPISPLMGQPTPQQTMQLQQLQGQQTQIMHQIEQLNNQSTSMHSQANQMHQEAAVLMSNPYTAAAGAAMEAQASSMSAQAQAMQQQIQQLTAQQQAIQQQQQVVQQQQTAVQQQIQNQTNTTGTQSGAEAGASSSENSGAVTSEPASGNE